jgi:hypothetical protein
MGARNRVGIGLSYRPARLHSPRGMGSLELILGLPKSLKFGLCYLRQIHRILLPVLTPALHHTQLQSAQFYISSRVVRASDSQCRSRNCPIGSIPASYDKVES